jgi:hypothetical protein
LLLRLLLTSSMLLLLLLRVRIQIGKGTAHTPLPAAPTKEDYKDKMPASLRRLLALKVVGRAPAQARACWLLC